MLSRTIIACVSGITLAVGSTSLYTLLGPGTFAQNVMVAVLLIVPIWIATLVAVFISRSRRSLALAVGLNAVCYLAVWLLGRATA